MKRRYSPVALVTVAIAALVLAGSAGAFQGEPDGYNGIPWGSPLKGLESMERVGTQKDAPDISLYRRAGDDLSFGRARLTGIEYGFSAGRLTAVTLKVDSLLHYLFLKEEAFIRFGKGKEMDPRAEMFIWEGDRTTMRLISAFEMS